MRLFQSITLFDEHPDSSLRYEVAICLRGLLLLRW